MPKSGIEPSLNLSISAPAFSTLTPPFATGLCFADLDDNSNISDSYAGGDADKPADAGRGQDDADLDNGGSAPAGTSRNEMENILRNVIDLTQKAYSVACSSQRQTGQDKGRPSPSCVPVRVGVRINSLFGSLMVPWFVGWLVVRLDWWAGSVGFGWV